MEPRYFEDMQIGEVWEHTGEPVTAESIIDFGRKYDPEPFHTDPEAARHSFFGELVASGAQTFALWRLLNWHMVQRNGNIILGGAGSDEMRLHRPVRPGDVLRVHSELIEKIPSRSKPDRGIIRARETVYNQDDEVVMTLIGIAVAARRPAADAGS
jgi:acyl dehydratase